MTQALYMVQTIQKPAQTLPARTLTELLNETAAIYLKHPRPLLTLAAAVQAPLTVAALLVTLALDGSLGAYVFSGVVSFIGITILYAAIAVAVGQHYVSGRVSIGVCFSRVAWRALSLTLLALVLVPPFLLLAVALLILAVPALALAALPIQSVVIEGNKVSGALARTASLVRGSGWRVLGVGVILGLVAVGLAILLYLPFFLLSLLVSPGDLTAVGQAIQALGSVGVAVIVPPVLAISGALLYYDLRVRKENYDLTTLSREMREATI